MLAGDARADGRADGSVDGMSELPGDGSKLPVAVDEPGGRSEPAGDMFARRGNWPDVAGEAVPPPCM